ncbi:MAG TPA: ABC transporter permease [Desulfopila sp.]|nr:ABC transporter permease [Desulfopila sp.]
MHEISRREGDGAALHSSVSKVGLVGGVFTAASLLLGDFVIVRPNRLAPGEPLSLFAVLSVWQWAACLFGLLMILYCSWRPSRRNVTLATLAVPLVLLLLLWCQGDAARELTANGGRFIRVSLGSSLWLAMLGLFVVFTDMIRRCSPGRVARAALLVSFLTGLALMIATGRLDDLSLVREFVSRSDRFAAECVDHLFITGLSVGCSAALGLPVGVATFKYAQAKASVFSVLNVIQTIPSLALFGLLIAPLAWLSGEVALLRGMGVRGIGWAPAVIALTLYALLPIVRNTYAGFAAIDRGVLEAGRGMGMGKMQMFLRVELPVAAPIILNGLRVASVQNIGNTAVAALVGAGGFGVFIFQGLGQSAIDLVLLGAVPTIMLAVVVDFLFQAVITFATPQEL